MKYLALYICLLFSFLANAQEDAPKKYTLNGYVKDLQSAFILKQPGQSLLFQDNLIHNRLNFKWFPKEGWTFKLELRNRLFWGDQVRLVPDMYIENLGGANDFFDLDFGKANATGLAFHTMIDRLYLEYIKNDWEVRLGRQRINWGINTFWNPNDVFNAFAFTDFDYEERPGSDALRVKRYIGFASSVEFAVKAFDEWEAATFASLVKLNKWNYDFQLLTGYVQEEIVLGGGWAGNIKDVGFKGEFSYFLPTDEAESNSFGLALGLDYITSKSLFLSTGMLYNSNGETKGSLSQIFAFQLSAKNLYPYKYSFFLSASYPFTPLLNGGLSLIYSPGEANALFLNPTITYSVAQNWDFDLIAQLAFNNDNGQYISPIQGLFLRSKFSF